MPRVTLSMRFQEFPLRLAIALLLAAFAFVAYTVKGHGHGNGDTIPASLMATTLLTERTFRLDRFADLWSADGGVRPDGGSTELAYFLTRTPKGIVSLYPVATGILATPLMVPSILAPTAAAKAQVEAAHRQERYAAAFITAASVAVFAFLSWQLGFGNWLTVGLTLFYALGSQALSTSSQLLWQHGPGTLFILLAFVCFVGLQRQPTRMLAACFALVWAVAVAIRPMNILAVGPLVVLALYRFPHKASLLLPACAVGLPVVAYNLYFFGTFSGGYGTQPFDISHLGYGIAGLTVSPGRGLFLYFPIAVVALALAIKRRVWATDNVSRAALIAVAATVFFYGTYKHWHGGGWVGPRYMTEVQPLLLVLLGLAWPPKARVLSVACFGVLLPYCIFIQAVGTYTDGPLRWNNDHMSGGWGVLWNVRDNPIAYAFRKTGHRD